jgi:hypothetical protein
MPMKHLANKLLCWLGYHDEYVSFRFDGYWEYKCRHCDYKRIVGSIEDED